MPDSSEAPLPQLTPEHAMFLDVDGTLLEIAPTPESVVVPPRVLRVLDSLRIRHRGALALVSGRAIADLDRLFAPLDLPAAGLHGLELRDAAGRWMRPAMPDWIGAAGTEMRAFVGRNPDTVFEDKGLSIALHYRLNPAAGPAAIALVASLAAAIGTAAVVQEGKMVIELRPAGGNKGSAIASLSATVPFVGRIPVFAGDDATDEHGFVAVNSLGGIALRVGPIGPTVAPWRVPRIDDLFDWLESGSPGTG